VGSRIETLSVVAFVLVVIGTLGLLANEYVFAWGSAAVLIFALLNVVGLAWLAVGLWGRRQPPPSNG